MPRQNPKQDAGFKDLLNALSKLYRAPADEFVETRSELAKAMAQKQQAATARLIAKARKPTQVAELVNRVAHAFPQEVKALIDAGHAVREAQEHAGTKTGDQLRQAMDRERDSLRTLMRHAEAFDEKQTRSHYGRILQLFRAAAHGSPEIQARLLEGALERELEETGFSALPTTIDFGSTKPQSSPKVPVPKRPTASDKAARQKEREAEKKKRQAQRALKRTEAEINKLQAAIVATDSRLTDLRSQLERARNKATDLRRQAESDVPPS